MDKTKSKFNINLTTNGQAINKKFPSYDDTFTYTVYNELENEIAVNMISQTTVYVESKYSVYGVSLTIAASCAVQESNCSLAPKYQKNEY